MWDTELILVVKVTKTLKYSVKLDGKNCNPKKVLVNKNKN